MLFEKPDASCVFELSQSGQQSGRERRRDKLMILSLVSQPRKLPFQPQKVALANKRIAFAVSVAQCRWKPRFCGEHLPVLLRF